MAASIEDMMINPWYFFPPKKFRQTQICDWVAHMVFLAFCGILENSVLWWEVAVWVCPLKWEQWWLPIGFCTGTQLSKPLGTWVLFAHPSAAHDPSRSNDWRGKDIPLKHLALSRNRLPLMHLKWLLLCTRISHNLPHFLIAKNIRGTWCSCDHGSNM